MHWEQRHLEVALVDLFGFHALQLGLPELDALRANRMPHRWLATDGADARVPLAPLAGPAAPPAYPWPDPDAALGGGAARRDPFVPGRRAIALHCDFDALPFDNQSLDLVVLPHALEWARDPHMALREVERVLVPEGRVVIVGFNPASLWGLRQQLGRWRRWFTWGSSRALFLPRDGDFMRYRRLRDWLRLLSFEVEAGRFGCYRPPLASAQWLSRFEWMERVGDRWWPVFGAVYFVVAVKRVRGMRLVGMVRTQRANGHAAPAPVVATRHHSEGDTAP